MSSSTTTPTKSDLRSTTRPIQRTLAAKAKWAYGPSSHSPGRDAETHPRPARPHEHGRHPGPRVGGSALKAACASRQDMFEAQSEYASVADHLPAPKSYRYHHNSSSSSGDESSEDEHAHLEARDEGGELITGASVDHAPSSGSQVLTGALTKAIEAFEDRETDRLVRTEYSLVNDEGEEVGFSPVKGKRGVGSAAARRVEGEDEYELV